MPQGNPLRYIGESGVIRLSPLAKAVASSKSAEVAAGAPKAGVGTGNGITANRSTPNPNIKTNTPDLPPGVTEADVAEAVNKANAGDEAALEWLKGLGIAAGTVATGYLVHEALKRRGGRGPKGMGADNIAVDAAGPNPQSAVAKKPRKVDLYVDLEASAVPKPAGYLPKPSNLPASARMPRSTRNITSKAARAIRILP